MPVLIVAFAIVTNLRAIAMMAILCGFPRSFGGFAPGFKTGRGRLRRKG